MIIGSADRPSSSWIRSSNSMILVAILTIFTVRLATLGTLAVTDNTEARHAEIGWHMYRTGNWVTPTFYLRGQLKPFSGKPPLSFWMTAAAYQVFGVSEWAARFPSWLLGGAIVLMTVLFGRRFWSAQVGLLAGLVLASSGLFFVLSGACILDMALAATVCLAMISFAFFVAGDANSNWWGRAFFLALGLGCLAKGPVSVVLVGIALVGWLAITRQWKVLKRLPWISGTAIAIAVAAPWYVLAEQANPGFLRYFLINEHILRYLKHDYGDRYGGGHTQPYGASWVMLVIAFLPWTPLLIRFAIESWRAVVEVLRRSKRDMWLTYAIVWGVTPAVFFTLCRQILVTYVVPGFAGLALAAAVVLVRWLQSTEKAELLRLLRVSTVCSTFLLLVAFAGELIYPVSPVEFVGFLAAASLCFAAAWFGHQRGDGMILSSAVGMGIPLFMTMVLSSGSTLINDAYSTKTIVAQGAGLTKARGLPIVLPMGDENSANFYVEACYEGRIVRHTDRGASCVLERVEQSPQEILVFKRKHWRSLNPEVRRGLYPVTETGHWVAFSTQNPPSPAPTVAYNDDEQGPQ